MNGKKPKEQPKPNVSITKFISIPADASPDDIMAKFLELLAETRKNN